MKRLIDDLRLPANADAGQLLHHHRCELAPFLSVLSDGFPQFGERRYEHSDIPQATLAADPDRIAQVLRNLVRNAVQQTQPGGLIRLTVAAERGGRIWAERAPSGGARAAFELARFQPA